MIDLIHESPKLDCERRTTIVSDEGGRRRMVVISIKVLYDKDKQGQDKENQGKPKTNFTITLHHQTFNFQQRVSVSGSEVI